MTAGLLLVGVSGYVFLAVTGHSPSSADAAALSSLYFLVGVVTLGVFTGLEQETSRATSRASAEGRALAPITRTAQRHTLVLLGGTNVILVAVSPLLVNGPLRGDWLLFAALIVGTVSASAVYLVRGRLGGQQQFVGYAMTLATEGLARLAPCVVIFLAFRASSGATAAYGFAFTLALSFAALVGLRRLRPRGGGELDPPGEAEAAAFESGERSAAGGLLLLVAASLLTQLVANLPPLVAGTRLADEDAVAAAFGEAFVLVRIPLLLTAPIQAMLLPTLTRSAAVGDRAALRRKVRQGLAAVLALGFAGTAGLSVAGPWVLKVFFGTETDLSHELLGELGVGTVFLMLTAILQPTLVALSRHRLVPLAWGLGAVVLAAVVVLPTDPVHAAAAGSVGGPLVVVAVMLFGLADALRRPASPSSPDSPAAVPVPVSTMDTHPAGGHHVGDPHVKLTHRLGPACAEAATALAACLVIPLLVRGLNVNPVERTGQVSALAALSSGSR